MKQKEHEFDVMCPKWTCQGKMEPRMRKGRMTVTCMKCGTGRLMTYARLKLVRRMDVFGQWVMLTGRWRPKGRSKGRGKLLMEYGFEEWLSYQKKHPELVRQWRAELLGDLL